ncbi:MAG TPA: SCO family protein [Ideonella sp.]|nr:SCO family protein [Ideonella sp.]
MSSIAAWLASAAVLAAGGGATWAVTDGLQAFTSEGARRLDVERKPRALPPVALQAHDGRAFDTGALRGHVTLVDFVYTDCATLCSALGGVYGELQRALAPELERGAVGLLSVSFDPQRDTPAAMTAWRARHRARPGWVVARARTAAGTRALLRSFGVVVVTDASGGFVHNATLGLVDADGRLCAIYGPEEWPKAAQAARRLARAQAAGDVALAAR